MDIKIIGFRLPSNTPDPTRHSSCGWVAICDEKEVGWCNMSFLPDGVIKYEDSFVHSDYRGRGIYRMLYEARDNYVTTLFKGSKIISYCKPITVEFFKKRGFIEKEIITLVEKIA
jgi:GNAT superfamily N-acetyltransferase